MSWGENKRKRERERYAIISIAVMYTSSSCGGDRHDGGRDEEVKETMALFEGMLHRACPVRVLHLHEFCLLFFFIILRVWVFCQKAKNHQSAFSTPSVHIHTKGKVMHRRHIHTRACACVCVSFFLFSLSLAIISQTRSRRDFPDVSYSISRYDGGVHTISVYACECDTHTHDTRVSE